MSPMFLLFKVTVQWFAEQQPTIYALTEFIDDVPANTLFPQPVQMTRASTDQHVFKLEVTNQLRKMLVL
eukprot:m.68940 g.68940  ORF g.68940 m.68940 type:complete len:69 (+) comp13940_c0_seq2:127-333(+)